MSNYLPVLLVSVSTNAIPDDSAVTILPRGQVDYLSHNWREEDVWRSWRNMTKQKNEITNGLRLENASWRTWWKQRNKLKTVTPEKLNWLKDSDVTWLYGPLHTDVDWAPPVKPIPANSSHDSHDDNTARKPILKHRSISELLTGHLQSPLFSPAESDNEEASTLHTPESAFHSHKPALLHTKSDTHITRWGPNRAFRRNSPPRVNPPKASVPSPSYLDSNSIINSYCGTNSTSGSTCSSVPSHGNVEPGSDNGRDTSPSSVVGTGNTGKRKHISFNTFVQQCIALEKPKKSSSFSQPWYANGAYDDDGYDEDEEDVYEEEQRWNGHRPTSDHDFDSDREDEDEDDDVLEMCTPSSLKLKARSKSKASSTSSSSISPNTTRRRPAIKRGYSSDRDHVTIAPIAPTILKTTDVGERPGWGDSFGDEYSDDNDARWYPDHERADSSEGTPVELVYVPPLGSAYHVHAEPESMNFSHGAYDDAEVGVDDTLMLPPRAAAAASRAHANARPAVVGGDREELDAYYFGGPDFGDEFIGSRTGSTRRRDEDSRYGHGITADAEGETSEGRGPLRYAYGGAASVTVGRSSGSATTQPDIVIHGDSDDHRPSAEGRGRSDPRPSSETSLLPVTIPTGRGHAQIGRSVSYSPPTLLTPPTRGRSALPKSASASTLHVSDNGARQERGRSSTRSSPSLSDRERGASGSPFGSLSPEGLGGLGGTRVYSSSRLDRDKDQERGRGRDSGASERGRERTSRRIRASSSSDSVNAGAIGPIPTQSPASSVTVTTKGDLRPPGLNAAQDRVNGNASPTVALPLEVEVHKLRNPTPANSPVAEKFGKPPFSTISPPLSPTRTTATIFTTTASAAASSQHRKTQSASAAVPALRGAGKQTNNAEQYLENGTLVSRAVGMVSSAGVYLGLWHTLA